MGHSSKFTFPIPGRKAKSSPVQPRPNTLTKAQKILGSKGISTEQPPSSTREDRWGIRSNSVVSGISISVSDTTDSQYNQEIGLVSRGEGRDRSARDVRDDGPTRTWEEESGVMPRSPVLNANGHDGLATDASSMGRRPSSSTIVAYYDKSKLPLSISQQTSNSAMAKGLPLKAQALLDMDGSVIPPKSKKKPNKLDLSHLIPRSRMSRHLTPDIQGHKPLVLGPDMVMRSPSILSVSPDRTPPLPPQHPDRQAKKSAKAGLMGLLPTVSEGPLSIRSQRCPQHKSSQQSPRPQQERRRYDVDGRIAPSRSSVNLYNLYEHYEQTTLHGLVEADEFSNATSSPTGPGPISPNHLAQFRDASYPTPPASSSAGEFLSPFVSHGQRRSRSSQQFSPSSRNSMRPSSPMTVPIAGPEPSSTGILSPVLFKPASSDCAASISSRHTRTSRASKRTDRSNLDLDLQLNSVLSLSSESEDDSFESDTNPQRPGPTPYQGNKPLSPSHLPKASHPEVRVQAPAKQAESPRPTRQALPTSNNNTQSLGPPRINARSSSLVPALAGKGSAAHSAGLDGRVASLRSGSTDMLPNGHHRPSSRGSLGSIPETSQLSPRKRQPRASLQPTPPLSPTNLDWHTQAKPSFSHSDARSLRSTRSVGNVSVHSMSESGEERDGTGSGRFMAVTKQEERLLAALRQKRAQIRGDIIAELEEEQGQNGASTGPRRSHNRESSSQASTVSRQSSKSTIRGLGSPYTAADALSSKASKTSLYSTSSSQAGLDSDGIGSRRGQILLMLDRPADTINDFDAAEPSPDLSDFMDFDDGSEESPDSSGSGLDRRSIMSLSGPGARYPSHSSAPGRGRGRASLSAMSMYHLEDARGLSNGTSWSQSRAGDTRVKIVEDPLEHLDSSGVPRPDSPLSGEDGTLSILSPTQAKRKPARLSAVGQFFPNMEVGWWDDDG